MRIYTPIYTSNILFPDVDEDSYYESLLWEAWENEEDIIIVKREDIIS